MLAEDFFSIEDFRPRLSARAPGGNFGEQLQRLVDPGDEAGCLLFAPLGLSPVLFEQVAVYLGMPADPAQDILAQFPAVLAPVVEGHFAKVVHLPG